MKYENQIKNTRHMLYTEIKLFGENSKTKDHYLQLITANNITFKKITNIFEYHVILDVQRNFGNQESFS